MMADVLVIGDMVVDTFLSVDRLPIRKGDVQISDHIRMGVGGSGNVLIAAARLGLKAKAFGRVGEDLYGKFLSMTLEKEEVDVTDLVFIKDRSTTQSIDLVDKSANHAFVGVVDAEKSLTPKMLNKKKMESTRSIFTSGYTLLFPGPSATVRKAIELAEGRPIFFDAGPVVKDVRRSVLEKVLESTTILFLNSEEAEAITRNENIEESALMLAEKGPEIVAIKKGADGCIIVKGDEILFVGGFKVEVIDTIGAGDAFDAAFIYGYLNGVGIRETGVLANAVGALSTTKHGAGENLPTKREINSFLKKNGIHIKGAGVADGLK